MLFFSATLCDGYRSTYIWMNWMNRRDNSELFDTHSLYVFVDMVVPFVKVCLCHLVTQIQHDAASEMHGGSLALWDWGFVRLLYCACE